MHLSPATPPEALATVGVDRWPSERPLLVLVALASLGLWFLLALSIIGIAYALLLAVFFFVAHVTFIATIRGTAVKLGPDQLPDLHARVQAIARRAGLAEVPDAYLLQADGSLNAFATKLFGRHLIVLFADLLDACGEDQAARDMVIGHEIGHVHAGHLRWHWLLIPGMLVPLLGAAYSRAREFTCDRYGAALCGDQAGAVRGLTLLAAGRTLAPRVNLDAYVAQQRDLDTGWLTIGRWLSGYPPLSARVAALRPSVHPLPAPTRGPLRAIAILAGAAVAPAALTLGVMTLLGSGLIERLVGLPGATDAVRTAAAVPADPAKTEQAGRGLAELGAVIVEEFTATGQVPADDDALAAAWNARRPSRSLPVDPYGTGQPFLYVAGVPLLYSVGPDGEGATNDDIDHVVELPDRPQ